MSNLLHMLIVEDSQNDAELIVHKLRSAGYELISHRVDTAEAMTTALDQES
jgi:CheY-like chemotaxis protein